MATTRSGSGRARPADPPARRPGRPRGAPRRIATRRATVRKVDPWSVLKLSVIFYFCLLLVIMGGLTVFWAVINQLGVIDMLVGFMEDLQLRVTIDGANVARVVFLVGLLNVVLWSGINVFLAFMYNLIADLVGGLRVTIAEETPVPPAPADSRGWAGGEDTRRWPATRNNRR